MSDTLQQQETRGILEIIAERDLWKAEAERWRAVREPQWQPMETAPKDGTWILLAGPSGYQATPLRVEVCRYYPEYRPNNPWQNHSNDAFSDGGGAPTHWMPLPPAP